MKFSFLIKVIRNDSFFYFLFPNSVSGSYLTILTRNFTTSEENRSSDNQDYYSDLSDKSNEILEKIKVSDSELLQNKDVVVYTRNRTCNKCNKTVKISQPELLENVCADAWRYFHNFSYVPNCPVYGIMKFTKYSKLRTEQKVSITID